MLMPAINRLTPFDVGTQPRSWTTYLRGQQKFGPKSEKRRALQEIRGGNKEFKSYMSNMSLV